ncbi:MAG: protoporphyrinogen oxidase, partial [Ignavibacteria bacterium]|nr:protoporphyrinogen oxidase [Ignavibacteria bacterium]
MDQTLDTDIVVIGAGVSGLSTAFWLHKKGFKVIVLEKNAVAGGSMESIRQDGFLFDRGPNSGLETTPLIQELVKDLGLQNEFLYSSTQGSKRYVMRDNELHAIPTTPQGFLQTKLFSGKAKWRVLKEPFIKRSSDGYYQSLADFVRRRLGEEFLDYAIDPFVSGVYAGDPEKLSVKSAFPKVYNLEEKYGGLIVGAARSTKERRQRAETSKQSAKMFSFTNGMQSLPNTIANKLGDRVKYLCDVLSITKSEGRYNVIYNRGGDFTSSISTRAVISTAPSYVASRYFSHLLPDSPAHFDAIYHPPVMVVFLGYKGNQIGRELDGFGYLIPGKENKNYLGAIWSSTIFPNRAPQDSECFTLFVGGARKTELFDLNKDELVDKVVEEFSKQMAITGTPVYKNYRFWSKAIPQYNTGYIEHENYFDSCEENFPGIYISGNFRGGI